MYPKVGTKQKQNQTWILETTEQQMLKITEINEL